MPTGFFASQSQFFKLRSSGSWFETFPIISVTATRNATDLSGSYEIAVPNPRGLALNAFNHFENQELWFAYNPARSMHRFMCGQVNSINNEKNTTIKIHGRGLNGLLTDRKITDSWDEKRGDFILCDQTFGCIPNNVPDVSTWNAFINDFDRFDYWDAARWDTQPAWCDIIDGELEVAGDGAGTRTVRDLNGYTYSVVEFRAKVSAAANTVYLGFTNIAGTQYVRFALAAGAVNCQNSDGTPQSSPTVDVINQTQYNYYRIEWDNASARFFVNGVLEVSQTLNVPAGILYPYFQMVNDVETLTIDHFKEIMLTKLFESYVAKEKLLVDLVSDVCDIGNSVDKFSFYIDDDRDFHAFIKSSISSGNSYGQASALYTGSTQRIISLELNDEAKDLYNFIRVTGGEKLVISNPLNPVNSFVGDASTTSFALGYKAKKPLNSVTVGGAPKIEDTDFSVQYGTQHTIIQFTSAPAAAVNVYYDYYLPIIATAADDASIAAYDITREYDVNDDTITSDDRASEYARALLAFYSDPRFVIKVTVPLDPRITVGTTVRIDAPFYGVNDTEYEIIQLDMTMGKGAWSSKMTLANAEINTSGEIIREILQQLKDLRTRGETTETVTDQKLLSDSLILTELLQYKYVDVADSFIIGISVNGIIGRGVVLEDWEA